MQSLFLNRQGQPCVTNSSSRMAQRWRSGELQLLFSAENKWVGCKDCQWDAGRIMQRQPPAFVSGCYAETYLLLK